MNNKNLKEKVITPITDALTKITENVSTPVNAVGLIPDNFIPKIECHEIILWLIMLVKRLSKELMNLKPICQMTCKLEESL